MWLATGALIVACGTYMIGAYVGFTRGCTSAIGGNVAILGVAMSCVAAAVLAYRGIILRSVVPWLACGATILLSGVMYFFIGVMYLGCGGV